MLRFYIGDDVLEKRDLLDTLCEVVLVFFLNLELEFCQGVVELAEKVYFITELLEVLIHKV